MSLFTSRLEGLKKASTIKQNDAALMLLYSSLAWGVSEMPAPNE